MAPSTSSLVTDPITGSLLHARDVEIYVPEVFKYPGECADTFENKGYLYRGCTNANTSNGNSAFPWCMKQNPNLGSKHPWAMCDSDNMPEFVGINSKGEYKTCSHAYNMNDINTPIVWGCYAKLDKFGQLETPLQCKSDDGEILRCIESETVQSSSQMMGSDKSMMSNSPMKFIKPPTVKQSDCLDSWSYDDYTFKGCTTAGSNDQFWCMLKPGILGAPTTHIRNAQSKYWGLCDPSSFKSPIYGGMSNGSVIECDPIYTAGSTSDFQKFKVAGGCLAPLNSENVMMGPYMCKGKGMKDLVQCLELTEGASVFQTEEGKPFPATVDPSECLDEYKVNGYSVKGCSNSGGDTEWCYLKAPANGFNGKLKYGVCNVNYMKPYFGKSKSGQIKKCDSVNKVIGEDGKLFAIYGCSSKIVNGKNGDYVCKEEGGNEMLVCLDTKEQEGARIAGSVNTFSGMPWWIIALIIGAVLLVAGLVTVLVMRYRKRASYKPTSQVELLDEDCEDSFTDKGNNSFERDSTIVFEVQDEDDEKGGLLQH